MATITVELPKRPPGRRRVDRMADQVMDLIESLGDELLPDDEEQLEAIGRDLAEAVFRGARERGIGALELAEALGGAWPWLEGDEA